MFESFFEFMVDKGEGDYLKILLKTKIFPQFLFELFFEFMVDKGEGGYLIPPPVSIHSLQDEPHNTMQCMNGSNWIQNSFVHEKKKKKVSKRPFLKITQNCARQASEYNPWMESKFICAWKIVTEKVSICQFFYTTIQSTFTRR